MAKAKSETHHLWLEAREKNSFEVVRNSFSNLFQLSLEYAEQIAGDKPKYEALIDLYEPYADLKKIDALFSELAPALSSLLNEIDRAKSSVSIPELKGRRCPLDIQECIVQEVLNDIGFDFLRGRLDKTVHPFCSTTGNGDVRLATRFFENDFADGLLSSIHEAGHGIYEQGLPGEHYGTPLGESCSLGIHESQSLLWEKHVARSLSFSRYIFPLVQKALPEAFSDLHPESFYFALNRVEPDLIRVTADEVSYGLHVIVRFELERDLVQGDLQIKDLPEAWREKYEKYLGIRPEDDLSGVLQDIHWYSGMFGYFPTYLLGAVNAAQLFWTFAASKTDYALDFEKGDFSSLLSWLRENIHRQGKRHSAAFLVEKVSGKEICAKDYLTYLQGKYGDIYDLELPEN